MGLDDLAGRGSPRPVPPLLVEKNASNMCSRVSSSMPQPVSIRSSATPSAVRRWHHQLPALGHRLLRVRASGSTVRRESPPGPRAPWAGRRPGSRPTSILRLLCLRPKEIEHLPDLDVQVARLHLQPPDLGEVGEIVEDRSFNPLAFPLDQLDLLQCPADAAAFRTRRRSSASSSRFNRMVEREFSISCARPRPAGRSPAY